MGRNAGWIAASAALARRSPEDAPHLIYIPEVPFTIAKLVADVKECMKNFNRCFIVAGEGIRDETGKYIAEAGGAFAKDAFGHTQLGGAADAVRAIVEKEVGVKARVNRAGTSQRVAMHYASATDVAEAYMAGSAAVKAAMAGTSGKMITLVRENQGGKYGCSTGTVNLRDIANAEKLLPREFINAQGNGMTEAFRDYVLPLIQGQAALDVAADGLPTYTRFARHMVEKKSGRQYAV
jgi:ATP-dependent phosphofructokinase / diphosphate-dependent phosphofructokinase